MNELDHARIARTIDDGELELDGGYVVPWVAMDLGGTNLRRHVQENGALNQQDLLRVSIQLSEGLGHLHSRGFIHRDVKPDNAVWFGNAGDIKMIDFGIAKRTGEDVSARPLDRFTQQMEFVGPAFYSSPELIAYANDKSQIVDARSDIFQLGKVISFLATGRISAGVPSLKGSPGGRLLRELVVELVADDPDERPKSIEELLPRLRTALNSN